MRFIVAALVLGSASAADVSLVGQNDDFLDVSAGEKISVRVTNATEVGSGYIGMYETTHIQIGILSMLHAYWMCSLTGFLTAEDGTYEVTVPPEMGPSGAYYKIAADGFNIPSDDSLPERIIMGERTNMVFLSGGTGEWTPAETMEELKYYGLVGFSNADIPCSSYECARGCAAEQFPEDSAWAEGTTWTNCLASCDGVVINWERITSAPEPTNTVEVPESLATASESCDVGELNTPCNTECCSSSEYCLFWEACVPLPINFGSDDDDDDDDNNATTTSGSPAPTTSGSPAPTNTGTAESGSEEGEQEEEVENAGTDGDSGGSGSEALTVNTWVLMGSVLMTWLVMTRG